MQQSKRWSMLCLTMMEWDNNAETKADFKAYGEKYYLTMKSAGLMARVNNWPSYF